LPFRREERLGRLARARDPLTIIAARGVMLLPMVEQELSRLFGYSRIEASVEMRASLNCARIVRQKFAPKNRNSINGLVLIQIS
jgi:hypothetical protein